VWGAVGKWVSSSKQSTKGQQTVQSTGLSDPMGRNRSPLMGGMLQALRINRVEKTPEQPVIMLPLQSHADGQSLFQA
jgi:hypothetical protein